MDSLKIVQVIPHYVPAYRFGGPLRVAHPLSRALLKQGHQVVVCTTNQADEHSNLAVPVDVPINVDGITVYYEPVRLLRYWGFSPALWRRINVEAAKADIILIHAHYQFANWAGALLARRHKKPYVIFAHGSLHQSGISQKSKWLKHVYLKLMEEQNFKQAQFVAFNAPEEKAQSFYQELGQVVYSGVDPIDFAQLPSRGVFRQKFPEVQGKLLLLFLGRLDIQQKGLDLLLPAFAKAFAKRPNLHLAFVGPDEDNGQAKLERLAAQYNISHAITFTGLLTGTDKLAALQDANAFVLPSRFEGLSIALLEALYMNLPLLVTTRVGLNNTIKRAGAGVVVEPEIADIQAGLLAISEPDTLANMQNRGRKLIEQSFTWDAIAAKLLQQIATSPSLELQT